MKNNFIIITLAALFQSASVCGQSNYLDTYIGATVTPTVIGDNTDQLNQPRDLDFKPGTNELWVCNYGTSAGGNVVIFYDAGLPGQGSQYRKDTHSGHFMIYPTSLAFGDNGMWAAVSEIQSTNGGNSTFMGPALWSADTAITARVFQNNWVSGYPLGSHLDMLHQSPFSMGIAHDSAMAYWVMDGHNGNICRYDYVQHHGPGYDNHSAGKIWRYIDVSVMRVATIPSHMVLDKNTGWLYFIDGGPKKIKRMNTNTGAVTGNLTVPSTAAEPLSGYWKVEGALVEDLATLPTQPCGIDYYNDRLVVSDYTTGDIYLYNTSGTFTLLATISTGHPGMMGVKVGPDGRIWCVNRTESKVYRLDVAAPSTDAAITAILQPAVNNLNTDYYSNSFTVCDGMITPEINVSNTGTSSITSMNFEYKIDNGTLVAYSWSGNIPAGSSAQVVLPAAPVLSGTHVLTVRIVDVNGVADDVDLNNEYIGAFRAIASAVTLPATETFTAAVFPPAGWNYIRFNPNNKMTRVTTGGFGINTGGLKMDNYSGQMNITGQKDYLISPAFDFTSAGANTWLKFDVAYARYDATSNDALQVQVSSDCGNTWNPIYNKSGASLATAPNATAAFTPSAAQWRTDSVNLAAYAGQQEMIFLFTATSDFGNNLYLDNIFAGDITTSVAELYAGFEIKAFPVPVNDYFVLSISTPSGGDARIEMKDFTGRSVFSTIQKVTAGENKIKFSSISLNAKPGLYLLHVKLNETELPIRIIIQ